MFLFNFKLFFKIAAAIFGGTSLVSNGDLNVDTVTNSGPKSIPTEVVINQEESVKALKIIQWESQVSDSLKIKINPFIIEKDI